MNDFTTEERDFLINVLENRLGDSKSEYRRTMVSDYKDTLRHEQELMVRLLHKLGRHVEPPYTGEAYSDESLHH